MGIRGPNSGVFQGFGASEVVGWSKVGGSKWICLIYK